MDEGGRNAREFFPGANCYQSRPDVDSIRENVVSGDLGDSDGVSLANPTHFRHDELDCCCGDRNANNERVSNQNEVIFMSKRDARRSSAQSDVKEAPYSSVLKAEIDDGDKINKSQRRRRIWKLQVITQNHYPIALPRSSATMINTTTKSHNHSQTLGKVSAAAVR